MTLADTRRVAALAGHASMLCAVAGIKKTRRNKKKGVFIKSPLRKNLTFSTLTAVHNAKEFENAFRMTRPIFYKPHSQLRPMLQKTRKWEEGLRGLP